MRFAMNRAVRTGVPLRVTSVTSTMPRPVLISTRRPFRVAATSYMRTLSPASMTISTRSPRTVRFYRGSFRASAPRRLSATTSATLLVVAYHREFAIQPWFCFLCEARWTVR